MQLLLSSVSSSPPHSTSQGPPTETKGSLSSDFTIYQTNPIPVAESPSYQPAEFAQLSIQNQEPNAAHNVGNTTCRAPGTDEKGGYQCGSPEKPVPHWEQIWFQGSDNGAK